MYIKCSCCDGWGYVPTEIEKKEKIKVNPIEKERITFTPIVKEKIIFVPLFKPSSVLKYKPRGCTEYTATIDILNNTIEFRGELFYSKKAFLTYLEEEEDCCKWLDTFYNIYLNTADTYFNNVFYAIKRRYNIDFK